MALLFADGFDHYGLDETNMLDGTYATASNVALSTDFVATGTHSLLIGSSGVASNSGGLRKVLPTSKTKMGGIARYYFPNMPSANEESCLMEFLTGTTTRSQITFMLDANGRISIHRGVRSEPSDSGMGQDTLLGQTDPIVVASAWNHIEFQVNIDDIAGWVRIAVNGVHRYELTGINTAHTTGGIVSVRICRYEVGTQNGEFYVDDFQLYDFVGDSAVDTDWVPTTDGAGVATGYIGELQCMYLTPNGDTAENDWVPSTGSDAFAVVDEVDPDDADYLYSVNAGDLTELELTDLPEEITYIRGLMLVGRMSKADAGAAMVKFGMKSAAATEDAPERPVTVEPTYWWDFINVDPDSGARWTRDSLNAAWLRLTRSV